MIGHNTHSQGVIGNNVRWAAKMGVLGCSPTQPSLVYFALIQPKTNFSPLNLKPMVLQKLDYLNNPSKLSFAKGNYRLSTYCFTTSNTIFVSEKFHLLVNYAIFELHHPWFYSMACCFHSICVNVNFYFLFQCNVSIHKCCWSLLHNG